MHRKLFTSESITEGHPDKICDSIADAILDAILEKDKNARVACEVATSTGFVFIMGEITTTEYVDLTTIARETICNIGYNTPQWGFNGNTCAVISAVKDQSPDIAQAVNLSEDIGAGDQGMMFGFACNETPSLMPLPITLAHALAKQLATVRKNAILPFLGPDGKTQVTVEYDDKQQPLRVDAVVVSTQHEPNTSMKYLTDAIIKEVVHPIIPAHYIDQHTRFFINPSGHFTIGGPVADTGLTGRKIIADTYGGYANHGGGSFSGKDPTKVDRSGAYAARYLAKNLVSAGFAERIELQLSYAIGLTQPIAIHIQDFGTATIPIDEMIAKIQSHFQLSPKGIIDTFDLFRPMYKQISSYGHFGREDLQLPWEQVHLFTVV
jgi:S-adenosylmethionine synthetase